MRFDKLVWAASVATFALVTIVLLTANAAPSNQDDSAGSKQVATTSGDKMQSLLDFDSYKRLFKKSYSGFLENMVRFKLFTSRAIRASISAIKYRFRVEPYHLAINHMSDSSREELDTMRNKVLERQYNTSTVVSEHGDTLPEFIPEDDENVVVRLRNLIEENAGKPEFEALRAELEQVDTARRQSMGRRRKRRVEVEKAPRELPLSKLVNLAPENPDAELPAETRAKIRARPKSNNPLYEGIEVDTQGLIDQQVKLSTIMPSKPIKPTNILGDLRKSLGQLSTKYLMLADDDDGDSGQPDEVFLDLRKSSNCLLSPRRQGQCGSCYAFTAAAVAEWLLCKTTGELTPLSEQYMMDCGKTYQMHGGIYGCEGGLLDKLPDFFHNFGFELNSAYPYRGREQQCPYTLGTDLRKVGYIRANLRNVVAIKMDLWPDVLEQVGPLMIGANTGSTFSEYGSGVYDGCVPQKPQHAMVLVGHGREDDQEYWLIRNSYSVGWGEGGYLKLSKKADCIWPRVGYTFGSDDNLNLRMKPKKNTKNDRNILKNVYAQQLKDSFTG